MAQAPPGPRGPTPKPKPAKNGPKRQYAHGLARVANQQIKAAQAPILHEIAQERAANLARAQAQMGFAKAAAAIMQQAAPNVQSGYTNAANATAGYARGLGDVAQAPLDQNAQANSAFLEKMGTPQGALQAAPPVGNLSYGTQGYIPATSLQREGAAWGAAAQLAPGHLLAQGQQTVAGMLGNNPNLVALQNQLARIAATRPDVYRQLVAQAQASRQAQQRIGISQYNADLRAQYQGAQLAHMSVTEAQAWARINISDASNRRAATAAIRSGRKIDSTLSHSLGYLVDIHQRPILNKKTGKRIPWPKSDSSGYGSGFSPTGPNGAGAGRLPIPAHFTPTHNTDGLPGYPAIDVFGNPGERVLAPSSGVIQYVHMIGWDGGKKVGGWTMYLLTPQGTYFLTHLGKITVKDGTRVKAGQPIGTLGAVPHGWWKPHIHVGFHKNAYPKGPKGPQ